MSNNNKFFKILKEDMLNRFDTEVESIVMRVPGIMENKAKSVLHNGNSFTSEKSLKSIRFKVEKSAETYLVKGLFDIGGFTKMSSEVKSSYTSLSKLHESSRVKGFAERHSGRVKKRTVELRNKNNLIRTAASKFAGKGKGGAKLFEINLKQAMPAIEKEITNLSII